MEFMTSVSCHAMFEDIVIENVLNERVNDQEQTDVNTRLQRTASLIPTATSYLFEKC